jgi:hypothetical protein
MLVLLQLVGVAAVPLNLTVLVPCVAPKFAPVIVMDVPGEAETAERLVITGLVAGVLAGRTSTVLKLKASAAGEVSVRVTAVPLAATVVLNCWVHAVSLEVHNMADEVQEIAWLAML